MKVPPAMLTLIILVSMSSCEGIIYAIRGSKYEGGFDSSTYPGELDSTSYYCYTYSTENKNGYLKFKNNGIYQGYTSYDGIKTPTTLDTQTRSEISTFLNGDIFAGKCTEMV